MRLLCTHADCWSLASPGYRALRDTKVQRLEEESAWFRAEALRLNKYVTAMRQDLTYLREKLASVEDEKAWADKQLKAAKRENALLQAQLSGAIQSTSVLPRGAGESQELGHASIGQSASTVSQLGVSRGELQAFLAQCIQDVRVARDGPGSAGASAAVGPLSFSGFTSADRRAVITRLLEDDWLLQQLHATVFPQASVEEGSTGPADLPSTSKPSRTAPEYGSLELSSPSKSLQAAPPVTLSSGSAGMGGGLPSLPSSARGASTTARAQADAAGPLDSRAAATTILGGRRSRGGAQ